MIGEVHHCDWRELARRVRDEVGQVDALIVDAPYSERTHKGHDEQTKSINAASGDALRQIDYRPWAQADVAAFVSAWAPLVRNWFVSITDEDLRGPWRQELHDAGMLTFARVPAIETGATVRFNGDGTPNWTTDVVTARTRDARHQGAWEPRPYYIVPREKKPVVGGKPLLLMEQIVEGYTRPGDLVCDPCAGGGTTLLAAKLLGRRYVGSDIDLAHVEIARERLAHLPTQAKAGTLALPWETE